MVLNLLEPAAHETRIEGNVLHVEVGGAGAADYLKPAAEPSLASLETSAAPAGDSAVAGLDFRRGDDGEGQLVIDLSDPRADISVAVEGERIKVRLRNATLPESLQRNYNVEDFATPVQSFRAESDRRNATITLRTRGDYDYLAYQASNRYVVSVKPLSRAEAEEPRGSLPTPVSGCLSIFRTSRSGRCCSSSPISPGSTWWPATRFRGASPCGCRMCPGTRPSTWCSRPRAWANARSATCCRWRRPRKSPSGSGGSWRAADRWPSAPRCRPSTSRCAMPAPAGWPRCFAAARAAMQRAACCRSGVASLSTSAPIPC